MVELSPVERIGLPSGFVPTNDQSACLDTTTGLLTTNGDWLRLLMFTTLYKDTYTMEVSSYLLTVYLTFCNGAGTLANVN